MSRNLKTAVGAVSALAILAGTAWAQDVPEALPDYYPDDYGQIVEECRGEGGLVIYSNMAEYNWAPVIEGFQELYGDVSVQTLDLDSGEVFERYFAEAGAGTETADMLVSAAPDKWIEFDERGSALDYTSPELDQLPEFAQPLPNVYVVSTDPMVIMYNKRTLDEDQIPKSLPELASMVEANPDELEGKVTTYDVGASSFGYAIARAVADEVGEEAWSWFEAIGPATRPERSSGPMIEKLTSGEYDIGYFISGIVLFPKLTPQLETIIGWSFLEGGTPLFLRGVAIPKETGSPACSKLMLDYILSTAGQTAFGKGGLTPYREDVDEDAVLGYTYQSVLEAIGGEDKAILIDYDASQIEGDEEFRSRWTASLDQ